MFYILLDCNNVGILQIVYFLKQALKLIRIAVPIILIIMCMIDAIKNVTSGGGWDSKIIKKMLVKFTAAVVVFLVPSILNILLNFFDKGNFEAHECWVNATKEIINEKKETDTENSGTLEDIKNNIEEALKKRKCLDDKYKKEHPNECK